MLIIIVVLLVLWLGLGVLGFIVKSLLWLGIIAAILFVVTAIFGWSKGKTKA